MNRRTLLHSSASLLATTALAAGAVAVVGQGMVQRIGVAGKVFTALANSGVNVRMINQGSSELNIIIGVDTAQYEEAVRAIYDAFVGGVQ